jgi:hypothetical protein
MSDVTRNLWHFESSDPAAERQRRIDQLLNLPQRNPDDDEVKRLLRDHDGFPRSICRYANDDPTTGI